MATYQVRRPFTARGRSFVAGERFDPDGSGLTARKVAQLVEHRALRLVTFTTMTVLRPFKTRGRAFVAGETFPLEGCSPEKTRQLLEYHYIQPLARQVGGAA